MLLSQHIDRRANNIDFLRFLMASLVIFSHSFPLIANVADPFSRFTLWSTLGGVAVYTFFTLSGILITKSWLDEPRIIPFLGKRFLRLFPALLVVVVLSVAVLGPLVTTLSAKEYFQHPLITQYLKNAYLFPVYYSLPGVFADLPHAYSVNGSLWTLPAEVLCYTGVAVLGTIGVMRFRWVAVLLLIGLWGYEWHVLTRPGYPESVWQMVGLLNFTQCYHYFLAGVVLYLYRDVVPLTVAGAAAALVLAAVSARTPNVHLVMRLVLPYLVCCAAFAPIPRLNRFGKYGDLSYGVYLYGFPVQQTVVYVAGPQIGWFKLFLISQAITMVLAFASWHLIEAPALRLKRFLPRRRPKLSIAPSDVIPWPVGNQQRAA